MVIDQIVLVGESCHKDNRPGHDDQHPGPENRCLMGRRRWYPLLSLYIRNMHGLHQTPPCSERQTFCARSGNCRGYASHPRWPFSGLYEQSTTQAGILVVRKRVICWAITSPSSPSAKGPVSSRWTSLCGKSCLNASAPSGPKMGSFLPHAAKSGG